MSPPMLTHNYYIHMDPQSSVQSGWANVNNILQLYLKVNSQIPMK